ncbi:HAMP domain-containing sensor histidine kinase [Clostridium aestuarii]|uniref:histidine kinase n=1 Tax=Clostridium aestuarii TaxID=338193 RepID=A0ABT4D271_9CLOT|nr:HAMP domain-containing sensor histidine kinase [Clostridium aestuarii]MCY6485344.1 HAMP domain-containing sensor histidine kinase [Clostridium aestuarii]
MKNKSIVYKLFFITVIVFTMFIFIQMSFQSLFFSRFYLKEKIKITKNNIDSFSKKYINSNWSLEQEIKGINRFIEENNSILIITNDKGVPEYSYMYDIYSSVMLIEDKDENYYKIPIDYIEDETDFEIKKGEEVYIEGIKSEYDETIIEPFKIEINGKEYSNKSISLDIYYDEDASEKDEYYDIKHQIDKIKGTIAYIEKPKKFSKDIMYKQNLLIEQVDYWFYNKNEINNLSNSDIISYNYDEPELKTQNRVFIKPVMNKNGSKKYIFVLTSLQPVDEAIGIMKNYYFYMFLLAIVFIIILSFTYSKMISKPLIQMNKVAKNMAELDFSTYCQVKSDDELGSLSKSLNILSKSLDYNMKELKKANKKLAEDIERERKQEKVRKEFVASVSHELKTPLGIMKGFAEGIKDGIYENKKDYYLEVIIDEIEKMNELVLDMLELSKLEARAYKLNKSDFSIKEIIINTDNKFTNISQEKNLKINLCMDNCNVYGDKRKIEQVIVNLFSNAIRYSKRDGFIKIKTESRDNEVYFYIENSGTHIPDEQLDKIWNRFYRVEKSRSKALGGTGLGLAIIKNILEMHESTFGVKNTNLGVQFFFSLCKAKNNAIP